MDEDGADPATRANDPSCHVLRSEPHRPRQLGSRLIYNVRRKNERYSQINA